MDSSKKYTNPSPEVKANFLSKILFVWVLPLFKYGYKHTLEVKDLYNTTNPDLSKKLGDLLEKNWNKEIKNGKNDKNKPDLMRALRRTFLKPFSLYGVLLFITCNCTRMILPIVLAAYINYFNAQRPYTPREGWYLASGVIGIAFTNILIGHNTDFGTSRLGMRVRVACCSLIYRKILRLSKSAQIAGGQLINLMSNDVARFDTVLNNLHYIWIMPIQAVIATYILYQSVGFAAFAGMIAISLQSVPLQGLLSRLQGKLRLKIALRTDERVKLMSEITSGIQVIKMYAWEKPFEKLVELTRRYEMVPLKKTSYIRGFSMALMVFTERATLFLTVIAYALLGHQLTSDKVFSVAQLFNSVQLYMAILYPMAVTDYSESKISIKRIQEFLIQAEVEEKEELQDTKEASVIFKDASASWIQNPIVYTLKNINLEIKPGTLCAVVGHVGAGKSSLLQLLLRELPLTSGSVKTSGRISYASQEPWLFVSSVFKNILFDLPYKKDRYSEVVKVCALEKDFEQFSNGDKTMIGERGVSLSGGQRARINLARAVYREADIYLFDDPLSAVDTHVSKHLFEECIQKYLGGKIRILVTHQLQFLKKADLIVILNNGQIEKIGTFAELSEKELAHLKQKNEEMQKDEATKADLRKRSLSVASTKSSIDEDEFDEPDETQELIEKGALSSSLYMEYFRSGGNIVFLIFLAFLFLIAQAACNASDIWVKHWTNYEEKKAAHEASIDLNTSAFDHNTTDFPTHNDHNFYIYPQNYFIYIYTFFIIASIILTTVRSLLFYKMCVNASINLHNKMFSNILQATMRFFDLNPSGRILNRFSKDMGTVDELLPRSMINAVQIFLVMSGILFMVFLVQIWMILPAILLGSLFIWIRVVYLSSSQNLKRLEGTLRAPVFSHMTASLNGLPTIRTCNAQNMLASEFDTLQDQHTSAWVLLLAISDAFGFYLDLISVIFLAVLTFQFLIFDDGTTLSGNVGLVISQSLILTGMLQHGIRQSADVSNQMTSVERVLQYTKLEKEGRFESLPTQKPPRDWPRNGNVTFKDVILRYSEAGMPVLKNLSFEIKSGEKIGIVGRTGAGKSSLISALFRLSNIEGSIIIDGIDTKDIGLQDLRSNISIIPQEPVLFSETVRYNLDPFNKHSDDILYKALEDVELKTTIKSLDSRINEGGSNLSVGQRQLICLARAITRNNKILIMDEATANVDPHTDALIQATIRKKFKHCTVLTIAHRLNTIIDSDKVLVMEKGQLVEFDHPYNLLQDPKGYFTKMVHETDKKMEENLRNTAAECYHKLNQN